MGRLTVTQKYGDEGEGVEEFSPWYFDTESALVSVENETDWDGNNNVSRTAGQFNDETLWVTAKGRLALLWTSQWQGSMDRVSELTTSQAVDWLIRNGTDPEGYKGMPEEVIKEYQSRQG